MTIITIIALTIWTCTVILATWALCAAAKRGDRMLSDIRKCDDRAFEPNFPHPKNQTCSYCSASQAETVADNPANTPGRNNSVDGGES